MRQHAAGLARTWLSVVGGVDRLHRLGLRSEHARVGAFASIGLFLTTRFVRRNKTGDDTDRADRRGIFTGH